MKDSALVLAASLLLVAFVLDLFVTMYWIDASESAMIGWIAWICGMAGIVLFISSILSHQKKR